jgi:hypothetical protein
VSSCRSDEADRQAEGSRPSAKNSVAAIRRNDPYDRIFPNAISRAVETSSARAKNPGSSVVPSRRIEQHLVEDILIFSIPFTSSIFAELQVLHVRAHRGSAGM